MSFSSFFSLVVNIHYCSVSVPSVCKWCSVMHHRAVTHWRGCSFSKCKGQWGNSNSRLTDGVTSTLTHALRQGQIFAFVVLAGFSVVQPEVKATDIEYKHNVAAQKGGCAVWFDQQRPNSPQAVIRFEFECCLNPNCCMDVHDIPFCYLSAAHLQPTTRAQRKK